MVKGVGRSISEGICLSISSLPALALMVRALAVANGIWLPAIWANRAISASSMDLTLM